MFKKSTWKVLLVFLLVIGMVVAPLETVFAAKGEQGPKGNGALNAAEEAFAPQGPKEGKGPQGPKEGKGPQGPKMGKGPKQDVTLTILHTNDIHGRAEATDKIIGYAKYKTIIDQYKAEGRTLVVDAGDVLHGTNFATLSEGMNMVNVMEAAGVEVMTPGNHDFNYGYKRLLELDAAAKFDILAANVIDENGNKPFASTAVYEKDGLKVGVFGIATPETVYKSNPLNTKGLNFDYVVREADRAVKSLRKQGADVIVFLSHLGMDAASEVNTYTTLDSMKFTKFVDVVIEGHSHTLLPTGEVYNGTPIASTGAHFANIGVTTITVAKNHKTTVESKLINVADTVDVKADPAIEAVIKEANEANKPILEKVIGNTATELDGLREHVRTGETNLGNLITDSMLKETGADVAMTNGGGIRASINAGEITMDEALEVLPFGNQVTVIEVTGQQIVEALNHGTSDYPNPKGAFPHVAGMEYTIAAGGVTDVKVAGEPIDLAKTYKLATNDFMAIGGDDYKMFAGSTQLSLHGMMVDILADYITELSANGPFTYNVEGRVK